MPTDLKIVVEIVGATDATPNGDGSGKVNLTLSGKNVTSYIVTLPTENKTLPLNASSGTVNCIFISAPGTTTQYPITVSAYCNTVKKDTTLSISLYCQPVVTPGQDLVWSDEFDGSSLDTNIWNYETGNNNGWGNNEKEYYTGDVANVSVKDGCLQITALHSPNYNGLGFDYTSARITTQNKHVFTYGKIEIRAKIPGDQGTWPALWMLGSNINTVAWPQCGEIDIMEEGLVTGLNNILCSLHWGGDAMNSRNVPGATTDFHLYSLDWRPDHIAFYIDNSLLYSQPNNSTLPFNQSFFFICNVAVGGNMGGNTINLASGSTMYVDYIRVYN
jgi:beta-glucanase (GH16 family)